MDIVVVLLGWLAIVLVSMLIVGYFATRWGRDAFGWLLLAAALGPFAIIALLGTRHRDLEHPETFERRGEALTREAQKVVLVACDGSDQSVRAATYAAAEYPDADEIVLVTVFPRESRPRDDNDPSMQEHEQRVDACTTESMDALRGAQINTRLIVGYGKPGEEILRAADEEKADAIVVGRRGAGLSKALLGSVSDYVTKNAKRPVVLVD
jgi:nucleotide-binding universal stress UspA family protein